METKTSFTQAHLENQLWANELEFYRDEIAIMERHLQIVASNNTKTEVTDKADWYRNQFARYRDRINELESELNLAETKMALFAQEDASVDLDEVNVADHFQFREKMEGFTADYQELKNGFRRYESEWM
ncbi:MAG TPA: hypothetical protein VHK91_11145 [Flavisolibacter sp.]|jgi:hypothetical protein|nr:hypothetical protein [Flavisolibacter sp.]